MCKGGVHVEHTSHCSKLAVLGVLEWARVERGGMAHISFFQGTVRLQAVSMHPSPMARGRESKGQGGGVSV